MPLLSLCSLLLCAILPTQAAKGDDGLDEARAKFAKPQEPECSAATEICVRKNSIAAVDLMLEILRLEHDRGGNYLASAHYRDVVWGGLARITDVYARQVVEAELKTNKENARVRQWCAELLGEYGDASFGDSLLKALGDNELGVQRAAARALGKVRFTPAAKALQMQIRDRDIYLRANAVEALARIDKDVHKATFAKALQDKDGGVRCALLGAAHGIYGDAAEGWAVSALEDEDWRPRLQAVDNLGEIRTKSSIDALIHAISRKDRAVILARGVRRLQELTGQKHRDHESWLRWWQANRESFSFEEGKSKFDYSDEATVTYHGIILTSDHAAFLIDKSDEMKAELKSKKVSKEEAALTELDDVMTKMHEKLTFNVFTYAEQVRAFEEKGPIELTAKSQKRALEFVAKAPDGSRKDIWQVLEAVIVDPDLDTAFLLSSGEPDFGLYVHWNRVTWHLKELNRFQKVVVHTIAYSDNEWYREQIEKLAECTGGEYRWFE